MMLSPPTRGRDLKLSTRPPGRGVCRSPPTRGRDLKLSGGASDLLFVVSPPTRGRDLKLLLIWTLSFIIVAPYTGA